MATSASEPVGGPAPEVEQREQERGERDDQTGEQRVTADAPSRAPRISNGNSGKKTTFCPSSGLPFHE